MAFHSNNYTYIEFSCKNSPNHQRNHGMYFQLPVGTTPASQSSENPENFSYLCVDGSKRTIREKACSWAARPWQGLMGHNDVLAKLTPLKEKLKQLADSGITFGISHIEYVF